MIKLTKINGEPLVVNALLIETVESTPDTLITTMTGHRIMVRDSVDQVIAAAADYHHAVGMGVARTLAQPAAPEVS